MKKIYTDRLKCEYLLVSLGITNAPGYTMLEYALQLFFVYETTKLFLMFRYFDTYDLTHARKYNYKRIISQFSKKLK